MGWSGQSGYVYASDAVRDFDDGSYSVGAITNEYIAEITSWDAEATRRVHSYGHSESSCSEVTVVGTGRVTGTIEVKLQNSLQLAPGKNYYLRMFNAAVSLSGIGTIGSVPISTRIDGGDPVSATYRFQSNGPWYFSSGTLSDGNT